MAIANDKANVSVGKGVVGGYLYWAPAGTALPTDYSTALAADYKNLGYVTDEGATLSVEADSNTFKDLNGTDIATSTGGKTRTLHAILAEMREDALKAYYGDANVTVAKSGDITVTHTNADVEHCVLVLELVLRDGRRMRRVIEDAQPTEWGDQTILYSDLLTLDLTWTLNGEEPIHDYIQAPTAGA